MEPVSASQFQFGWLNEIKLDKNSASVSPSILAQINFSDINFPEDRIWHTIPSWEIAVKITTFLPIIIFGIFANLIILHLIVQNRALRTPTNLLIGNMAAADTLTLIFCPIMFMYHDFFQNYMLGAGGCKIEGFLEGAFLITAVLNLSAVSYDRLTAIVLPKESRLTLKGAKIVMALTWIAGFLLSVPLAVYRTYKEREWKNFLEKYCKENQTILPKYWYVLIAVLVWFPLGLMLISYSAIFYKLDRYEREVLRREHPMSVSYKKKVAKTLYIILIVFIVLRVPFTVLIIYRGYMLSNSPSTNQILGSFQILWYVSHYLIFLNAAVNPIIYGLNNDNFRRAYDQTPICSCRNKSSTKCSWFRDCWWPCQSCRCNSTKEVCSCSRRGKRLEITQFVGCSSKSTKNTFVMKSITNVKNSKFNEAKFNYFDKDQSDVSVFANGFI